MNEKPPERLTLEIPSDPAFVGAARLFASAVGRHYGAEEESVEDLKLAISEACAAFLRGGGSGSEGKLRIGALIGGGRVRFEVADPSGTPVDLEAPEREEATPDSFSRAVSVGVIEALFEGATVEARPEGGVHVVFSFPISG